MRVQQGFLRFFYCYFFLNVATLRDLKEFQGHCQKQIWFFWFLFLIFALIFIIPLHCSFQYQVFIFGKKIFAVHALIVWIVFYDFLIKCNSFNEQIGGFSSLHYN